MSNLKTVMIVDDDEAIRNYYRKIFQPQHDEFDILGDSGSAESEETDLRIYSSPHELIADFQREYDAGKDVPLCIFDMRMPEMNGLDAAEAVRRIAPRTGVIICTAFSDASAETLKKRLSSNVYLVHKPFAAEEFMLLVHSILREWESNKALAGNEERLRQIIEATQTATWEWNVQTGETIFSRRWAEIVGYSLEELEPLSIDVWVKLAHPDDLAVSNELLRKHFIGELPFYDTECRMKHKNGNWVWVHDRGQVVARDSSGNPVKMSGTHTDITQRKQAEEELRKSREQFRQLAEVFPETIFEASLDGRITYANDNGCSQFGYSSNDILSGISLINLIAPEYRELAVRRIQEKISGEREGYTEYKALRKDGSTFDALGLTVPIMENEKAVGIRGFILDITQRKETEAALEQMVQKLNETVAEAQDLAKKAQAAADAKSEFLANMSHEIRTPMNGVVGMTRLLLASGLTEKQTRYAETIMASSESLLALLNDILDFSKIEAGHLSLEEIEFNLQELMDEFVDSMAVRAAEKSLDWSCFIEPNVPVNLIGDPGRFRQIVTNLVGNAFKFTAVGSVSVRLSLLNEDNETAVLRTEVSDTGIGIPADKTDMLFDKFTQADSSTSRKYGGTGLGLAISKQLSALMEGEIGAESSVGKGSRFWFTVKMRKSAESQSQKEISLLTGKRVLAAVHTPSDAEMMRETLKAWAMRPTIISSGTDAAAELYKAVLAGDPYDMVIADENLPDLDGISLGKIIRANENFSAVKTVLMTPFGSSSDTGTFSGYLSKPIRILLFKELLVQLYSTESDGKPVNLSKQTIAEPAPRTAEILLVEDNPTNQLVALGVLQNLGYHADKADNGIEALRLLAVKKYDLILMDCQMPELDGYETTARIRAGEAGENGSVPIIAMTANALRGDREKCLAVKMNDYISKPIDFEELREKINRYLGDL